MVRARGCATEKHQHPRVCEHDHVGFGDLHIGRQRQSVDIPELPGRHSAQRHREVHAAVDGEGRGRLADAPAADRGVHVHVHQVQQPVRRVHDQEKRQHHVGFRVSAQDRAGHERVFQGNRRGEYTR